MKIVPAELSGIWIIEPQVFHDSRGFFVESYNRFTFGLHGLFPSFVQDNHSFSLETGTLRGLHYQLAPKAQSKLVMAIKGSIFDVVVDIRKASPTFGAWAGMVLSEANRKQLFIPAGFAHGYYTLEPNTLVYYKVDQHFSPEQERGFLWCDPEVDIRWPEASPILSEKDRKLPLLKDAIPEWERL